MRRSFFIAILFITGFLMPLFLKAQSKKYNTRPKLGLVLSGGGAKGFAHIGALKVIEEAGLQFDYIGGTSMGSIIGSLYALGYHPDSIAKIVRSQDWTTLMNDKIPRSYIPIEEKQNSDRFIVTFPIVERKVQVKQGLHSGQMVDILLAEYLSPAYKINSFDKLPVPFLCIGTDLEFGSNVVFKKGVLHNAVKASMSIPSYFNPVKIDGQLIVDGGVINNFPVEEVKKEGMDLIIGVDVQTGLHAAENLNSIFTILDQITSFYRMSNNEKAVRLADIYIKPDLKNYDMMSFNSYEDIMRLGEMSARLHLPRLKRLADSIQLINPREPRKLNAQPIDSVFVTFIQYNGLKRVSKDFVDGALNVYPRRWLYLSELNESLKRAYGSGFFESINYYFIPVEEGVGIVFTIQEASSGIFGAGIHYDSDFKVGLLLNATFKNLGIKGSKLFVDLNLGENLRLQGLYLVDRGSKTGYGVQASVFNLSLNQYEKGRIIDVHVINQNKADIFTQWTFQNTMRLRAGMSFENIQIKSSFGEQVFDKYNPFLIASMNWSIDTYNKTHFSTHGSKLDFAVKHVMPLTNRLSEDLVTSALIFSFKHQNNVPINSRNTFKPGVVAGFTIQDQLPPPQHWFIVGGQSHINYFDAIIPFTGLRFIENAGLYTLIGNFAWQYSIASNFYVTAKWDMGFVTDSFEDMLNRPRLLSGFGVTLSYNSFIGPVELSLMGSNVNKGMSNFINIGYWF